MSAMDVSAAFSLPPRPTSPQRKTVALPRVSQHREYGDPEETEHSLRERELLADTDANLNFN